MHWRAIFGLRCPRCLRGKAFQSLLVMHEHCPECGLKFAREPGFFLGATLPICAVMFYHEYSPWAIFGVVMAQLALMSPLLLRYSRVAWLHFDQRFDPR